VNQRYKPSRHLSTQQREPPELLRLSLSEEGEL